MVMSGVPPPIVDALGRVRRRTSGTRLWTCGAGTRIRSAALHQSLTIGGLAADRAGARPFAPIQTCPANRYFGQQWQAPTTGADNFVFRFQCADNRGTNSAGGSYYNDFH